MNKINLLILALIDWLKPYTLADNCGTKMHFWTEAEARSWLTYAGPVAVIGKRGKAITWRARSFTK